MSTEKISKINKILQIWPPGTIATLDWLEKYNIYQRLAYKYEESGWFERLAPGVYKRAGDTVGWEGALYALQKHLGLAVHVGGKTALELKGYAHFIPTGPSAYVYLFGNKNQKIRTWFMEYSWKSKIVYKRTNLFEENLQDLGVTTFNYPYFDLVISAPERAILELLYLAPKEQRIEESILIMEGLYSLRADLMEILLINCQSIKVKRLFLSIAERCELPCLKKIDISKINLGHGKREIVKNGIFDSKYLITLPKKGT